MKDGEVIAAVLPDTFPKLLAQHARERGELPAVREKNRGIWHTLSWRALADEVSALAAALAAHGVARGTHVALIGDNRPRLHAALAAVHGLGAVAVPLYQDATADEVAALLDRAGATYAFAENQEQVDKLLATLPRCPALRRIVYDDDRGMRHYRQPQLIAYAALLKEGQALPAARRDEVLAAASQPNADAPAFLFFTAGATGAAKGVVLTHAALIDRGRAFAAAEKVEPDDVTLAYLPPGWMAQNFVAYVLPMVVGHGICCPESSETMLADMREVGPTRWLAPPRVLQALKTQVTMRAEDAGRLGASLYRRSVALARSVGPRVLAGESVPAASRLGYRAADVLIGGPLRDVLGVSRLRAAYTAGDAIDPELLLFFRALGVNLKQLYGSTETGFLVALQRDGAVKADTVGRAADGVELKISPEGEVLVRSPGLFKEYHRDPLATGAVRDPDGFFRTGDAGRLGDDGELRIVDRLAHVGALADGTPFLPRRLENKLKVLPHVKEAVAFGDGRDRVAMLIDIDAGSVGRWADRQDIAYTGHADLASRDEVVALIARCIGEVNAELAREPELARLQTHRFAILPKELDADDGVLTRTGKLRREVIAERFAALIEALHAGQRQAAVGSGAAAVTVAIGDAPVVATAPARKAAAGSAAAATARAVRAA